MEGSERYGGPASHDHLVKHDNPKIITQKFKPVTPRKKLKSEPGLLEDEELSIILPDVPRGDKKEPKNPALVDITSAEDILDYILPPRLWVDNDNHYMQKVSRIPATRMDVLSLQEKLDVRLEQQKAKETGIDPARRELYCQAFDELIRQATLECAERGLMLLRVRDEIRMTIAAYQTLFESSMAYGMRKVLLGEQGKKECSRQMSNYGENNQDLQNQLTEWKTKFIELDAKNQELREADAERKRDEMAAVVRTNQQLASVLDNIIVQRTLVFNTGSGLGDGLAASGQPAKDVDVLEKSVSKHDNKDASKTSVHSEKAEESKKK